VNRWLTVSWSNRGDINDDDGEEEEWKNVDTFLCKNFNDNERNKMHTDIV
jgi:hypothetical protein